MRKYPDPELLEETFDGYLYWNHSKNPINIEVKQTEITIEVRATQYYKGHVNKELEIGVVKLNPMSREQKEEFVLDVVEKFLNEV